MSVQYVKRYQMMYDLATRPMRDPKLPRGFAWVPWSPSLLKTHGEVKYYSFCDDMDGQLFPSFSSLESCIRLMDVISTRTGFLPEATWLIGVAPQHPSQPWSYCATIQGLRHSHEAGGIQNVGVLPDFRRMGLGEALVRKCLFGFQYNKIRRVGLEVTADNTTAVQLYARIGFKTVQTVYKETRIRAEDLENV